MFAKIYIWIIYFGTKEVKAHWLQDPIKIAVVCCLWTNQWDLIGKMCHTFAKLRNYIYNVSVKWQYECRLSPEAFVKTVKIHSHSASATTTKNDLNIEVYVAVEVADVSVRVNRSICCHGTHCLSREINVMEDGVAAVWMGPNGKKSIEKFMSSSSTIKIGFSIRSPHIKDTCLNWSIPLREGTALRY